MKPVSLKNGSLDAFTSLSKSKSNRSIDVRAYIAAGLTVVLWASAFPGIRAALQSYTPVHIALIRYTTASIALALYALFVRMRLPRLRDLPGFALLGLVGIAYYNVALNIGEIHIPSAEASFLIASAPIFMAVEAIPFWENAYVCGDGLALRSVVEELH